MIIYSLPEMSRQDGLPRGSVAALGFFDGVHTGHRVILETARLEAAARNCGFGVWTIAAGDEYYKQGAPLLTEKSEKARLLSLAGASFAAVSAFPEIRGLDGEAFVKQILKGVLKLSCVVCGYNFKFGHGAALGAEELKKICAEAGIDTVIAPPVTTSDGESISSTKIRAAITDGRMDEAEIMLGRPYSFTLPVLHGKKLGRLLGFPTANQRIPKSMPVPTVGVYAVAVTFEENGKEVILPGAANIGHCPTVDEVQLEKAGITPDVLRCEGAADKYHAVCETYIVGYSGDLYGKNLKISFLRRLRGETCFDGVEELKAQIKRDAEVAEKIFNKKYLSGKL